MNKYVNPPCNSSLVICHVAQYKYSVNAKKRWGPDPLLEGVSPVTIENWQMMRVSPRAALSQICILSPLRIWLSEKERSAWGAHWRRWKRAIIGLKRPVNEIALLTSWAAWIKRVEVIPKDSRLRTFCSMQIYCQRLYWRVWSLLLICHCVSRHSSYSFSFPFDE